MKLYFVSRFVLKGPCYNPLDVMNCLMTRRGYKVISPAWDLKYTLICLIFLASGPDQKILLQKCQTGSKWPDLVKRKFEHISSKRDVKRRPTFVGAGQPPTTNPPKHPQQGWQVRIDGKDEEDEKCKKWLVMRIGKKGRRFRLVLAAHCTNKREIKWAQINKKH